MKLSTRLKGSTRIIVPYAVGGILWFPLISALSHFVDDTGGALEHGVETAGGVLFVVVSLLMVKRLLYRGVDRLRQVNELLEERVAARTEDLRREISERARAEETLRASEQRFRDIAEAASDWIWEIGPELRFTNVSRRFAEATGMPAAALVGRTAECFIEMATGQSIHAAYVLGRRPFRDVAVVMRLGKVERYLNMSGRPIGDAVGAFRGYRGTASDITEHRRDRRAAERLQHHHELILRALGEGVFGFDTRGHVTFVNPAATEMTGWSIEELVERPVHATLHQSGDEANPADFDGCSLYRALKGRGAVRVSGETFRRRDGGAFPVEFVCTPVIEDGAIVGAVVVFHDVTERLRVERELFHAKDIAENATRAKSDFLAHMSHELRTPLNAVIGFSDIILAETFGPVGNARYRDYIQDIRRSGEHLLGVISDILDLSKIEAGKLELAERPTDVSAVVEDALSMIRQTAEARNCIISNNVPGNLPPILADQRRLTQVMINLLSNAVKFTPAGGHVMAAAEIEPDGALLLKITDTGIGIAPEDLSRVTDVFVQGNIHVAREAAGAGLGLPLAKHLIELHGGRLEIASQIGVGTTVSLWFPPSRLDAAMPIA
ncbi:MAG: PAS domain S-box protein [Alphaproteobacteria bacterium]|nr:PAS domain S-box protein [Alphaproteobacteria bacterium]